MGFDTIEINLVFSQIRSEGGVIKSQFFPKLKIVYIILGGGGGTIQPFNYQNNMFYLILDPSPYKNCLHNC